MAAGAGRTMALAPSNPIARLTEAVFSLIPAWLPLLLLRLTLARPFFASGLTRWDGWFNLSFGTKILFEQDYKLHFFGAEIPFPLPDSSRRWRARPRSCCRSCVAFGFLTRWAALGLLCMTAVIQLTYPDAWPDYHLPWAAMALAIMTFGPGAVVDRPAHRPRRRDWGAPGPLARGLVGAQLNVDGGELHKREIVGRELVVPVATRRQFLTDRPPGEQSERVRYMAIMQECPAPPQSTGRN